MKQHHRRFAITAALALLLLAGAQARTWTSADGTKTFDGELHSYDPATGKVAVTLSNGRQMAFQQDKLSADDIAFLKANGAKLAEGPSANKFTLGKLETDPKNLFKRHDGKPADMSKPVQVFILMGQSNMVGLGNLGTLEEAVKSKSKYPYLVDEGGAWTQRKDVRNVFVMCSGKNKEFKGNVATVYANPLCKGGSGNSHYDGNAETYMDVAEAMGQAMVELLNSK
jgi:hypothetical protein